MKLWWNCIKHSQADLWWAADERHYQLPATCWHGLLSQQHWRSSSFHTEFIHKVNQQKTYPTPERVNKHLQSPVPETVCFGVRLVPALRDRKGKQAAVAVYALTGPNSLLQPASRGYQHTSKTQNHFCSLIINHHSLEFNILSEFNITCTRG